MTIKTTLSKTSAPSQATLPMRADTQPLIKTSGTNKKTPGERLVKDDWRIDDEERLAAEADASGAVFVEQAQPMVVAQAQSPTPASDTPPAPTPAVSQLCIVLSVNSIQPVICWAGSVGA